MTGSNLEERLRSSGLLNRIQELVAIVEDTNGDVKKADEAEMRLIEELRRMGSDAMHAWAKRKMEQTAGDAQEKEDAEKRGKKTSGGAQHLG